MLQYDFEESVGYWITSTAHVCQQALNEELAPYGITFRQFQVLAWLVLEGKLTQTELARRMIVEPPTLVGILDRMEKSGWICRNSSPADRRKKPISVQPAAEPIWAKMVACMKRVRERATEGMLPEEVESLKTLLQNVQENLGARMLTEDAV